MHHLDPQALTHWLQNWSDGDAEAGSRALSRLYQDLRRAAAGLFRRERADHTLQATALVHEAYLQLSGLDRIEWKSRTHFLSVSARLMRRILVDHSRQRGAHKRGGDLQRITLSGLSHLAPLDSSDMVAVDEALTRLAAQSSIDGRIVELTVFGGLTQEEVAEVLGLCRKTVGRRWKKARAWLYGELKSNLGDGA